MILSYKQKRLVKLRMLERFPGAEIVNIRSIQKAYTDSRIKVIIRVGNREEIHYTDLVYIKDEKGQPV